MRPAQAIAAIEALELYTDDAHIIETLADSLIAHSGKGPFVFSINHDVCYERPRDVRTGPCVLKYDWRRGNRVGIDMSVAAPARQWIVNALTLGYTVARLEAKREIFSTSLTMALRRIALRAVRPRVVSDDEVPF